VPKYIQNYTDAVFEKKLVDIKNTSKAAIMKEIESQGIERQISYLYYIDIDSGWPYYCHEKDFYKVAQITTVKTRSSTFMTEEDKAKILKQ
jgi:hypothetical protein